MTVDKVKTVRCDRCRGKTNNYESKFSEITDKTYCSDVCKEKSEREHQAECGHQLVKEVEAEEDAGVCEECGAELVKRKGEWERW